MAGQKPVPPLPIETASLPLLASRLFAVMPQARRRQFAGVLALMLAGALAELFTIASVIPFLSLLGGTQGSAGSPLGWLSALSEGLSVSTAALVFILATLVATGVRLWLTRASQSFTLGFGHDLSVEIQRRVLHQPYGWHIATSSSRILASLEKVQILSSGVLLQLMQAASGMIMGLFIIAALFAVDPLAAAIAFGAVALAYLLVSRLSGPRLTRTATVLGQSYDRRIRLIQDSLGGIRDIILDHSQPAYLQEFRSVDRAFARARLDSGFLMTAPRFAIEAAAMLMIVGLALWLSADERGLPAALPVLGALALGALRLLPLLQQIYQSWVSVTANRSVASEVLDLLALPVVDAGHVAGEVPAFQHSISLEDVGFTYPARSRAALQDINLIIPRGARVALIGKTGSGKSTLVDLLLGLIEPTEGRILVDDVPLTAETRQAWQHNVAHVPQSVFLTNDSVARNIAFGSPDQPIDHARVMEAARIAQLDEVIASLPDGLETSVGERGVSLSGGQRQRLGIARAIYKDAPVLLLDEATNALDSETEAAVIRALDELHRLDKTILIISHRESSIRNCDFTVRLDKGKIVAIEAPPLAGGAD